MGQEHSGGGDISRSLALMWGYDDKAAGGPGPRPRLTLEAIVDRAVAVADAEGLDAVSMRRVATELGVGTMSLYRYLPGKAELLDLMLERVSALDEDARLDDDWREAMRAMGTGLWRLYTEHPWLPLVDQTRPLLGPNALRGFDLAVGALSGTGMRDQEKVAVIMMIDSFAQSVARSANGIAAAERLTGVSNEEFWKAQEPVQLHRLREQRVHIPRPQEPPCASPPASPPQAPPSSLPLPESSAPPRHRSSPRRLPPTTLSWPASTRSSPTRGSTGRRSRSWCARPIAERRSTRATPT
jgi:AcrR family transcriptional regulator